MIWPAAGPVTSEFGPRDGRNHDGLDIGAPAGAAVRAATAGVVSSAGMNLGGYGNLVIVAHPGGRSTYYAHLSKISVGVGQAVAEGAIVGLVGSTGRSSGPHLHFEVRDQGRPINPRLALTGQAVAGEVREATGEVESITGLPGPLDEVVAGVLALRSSFEGVSRFAAMLADPKTWSRVVMIGGGATIAVVGLGVLTKDVWAPAVTKVAKVGAVAASGGAAAAPLAVAA